MKKSVLFLLLIILFTIPALAQTGTDPTTEEEKQAETDKILDNVDDSLQAFDDKVNPPDLKKGLANSDKFLENQIKIPEALQTPAKIIFGLEDNAPLNLFIISLMIWLIIIVSFIDILTTYSSFSKPVAAMIGLLISIIAAASGVVKSISLFLVDATSQVKFIESLGILGFIILIVIILILFVIMHTINRHYKYKKEISDAEEEGIKAGSALSFTNMMRKMFGKLNK